MLALAEGPCVAAAVYGKYELIYKFPGAAAVGSFLLLTFTCV